ncbi:hypothetical protein TBLA_0A01350 [Henningerozyma blattae CBS 6284]|uniref:Uncharacterized protein n=1 Tax=Henningerozyma blattae (strain ATCC 34711 / CBS 6284 / DSM 70876 / NBRC 10599 / NRRL Y-10934 / UCD 77-7) TaxID=1071380 RepID=I2GUY2_HENB6|nr:hypothetical protein TBLA_0A01350 [Tetrapisispora blattae CBS 6284]CCH57934.1 hypothetical protein TBLA_0A01350 [Tetrapisispora blattae CBS 6284]
MFSNSIRNKENFHPKIAILGSPNVGKTALTIQYAESRFLESYYPSIQNEFTKIIRFDNEGNCSNDGVYELESTSTGIGNTGLGRNDNTIGTIPNNISNTSGIGQSSNSNNILMENLSNSYHEGQLVQIIDLGGITSDSFINLKNLVDINGIMLVYNVINRSSFESIKLIWNKLLDQSGIIELLYKLQKSYSESKVKFKPIILPVVIVGNKIDLRDIPNDKNIRDTKVTFKEGQAITKLLCESLNKRIAKEIEKGNKSKSTSKTKNTINLPIQLDVGFIETSAKLNINVNESFSLILKKIYKNFNKNDAASNLINNDKMYKYGFNFNFNEYNFNLPNKNDDENNFVNNENEESCNIM